MYWKSLTFSIRGIYVCNNYENQANVDLFLLFYIPAPWNCENYFSITHCSLKVIYCQRNKFISGQQVFKTQPLLTEAEILCHAHETGLLSCGTADSQHVWPHLLSVEEYWTPVLLGPLPVGSTWGHHPGPLVSLSLHTISYHLCSKCNVSISTFDTM